MFSMFKSSRQRTATLDLLTRQDDRLLADIGLTRADLEWVLHRPLPQGRHTAEWMLRNRA